MAGPIDPDKMEKLPAGCRFFDINEWWYFPNRWVARLLYPLPISANQVTALAGIMGVIASGFYFSRGEHALLWGALFLYGKLFLDNVDGPLARLRGEESRLGRFLDSFSDFIVAVLVYGGITFRLAETTAHSGFVWALGGLAMVSSLLQCSYWVFYYVSYSDRVGAYEMNRADETVTEQDREAVDLGKLPAAVIFLQWFHHLAYGWQDALIAALDRVSRKVAGVRQAKEQHNRWFADKKFLVWMGPLCVCTNTMGLVVFSLLDQLELFLYGVVVLGNGYLIALQVWKIGRFRTETRV